MFLSLMVTMHPLLNPSMKQSVVPDVVVHVFFIFYYLFALLSFPVMFCVWLQCLLSQFTLCGHS